MVLLQLAAAMSTVLPTAGNTPLLSSSLPADQATS